jgi:hypothetical protein
MVSTRENSDLLGAHVVNEAMLIIDALGPATGQIMFQPLRLANASEGVSLGFLD